MSKPTDDIEVGTDGSALVTEPDTTSKRVGWTPGEEPPAQWFTWYQRAYWRWIAWLDLVLGTDTHQTILVAGDSSATRETITATAAATNKGAIKGTGNGTGAGVAGVGSGNAADVGVSGTATGSSGAGVLGTNNTTGGAGVKGTTTGDTAAAGTAGVAGYASGSAATGVLGSGTGTSYGGWFQGDPTSPVRAAFHLEPQDADPSGPNQIGDIYVTTSGKLKICTVSGTPGTWTIVGTQS